MNNSITEKLKGMPASVKWSLFLFSMSMAVPMVASALKWDTLVAEFANGPAFMTERQLLAGCILIVLMLVGMIVLTALGKNWMRYTLLAMYAFWVIQIIFDFGNQRAAIAGFYPALRGLISLTSVGLLFTKSANRWFKRKSSVVE